MPKRKRVSGSAPLAPVNTTNEDEISPAHDSRRRSTREKHGVDRYKAEPSKLFYQPRFEFVPSNGWHPLVRQLNCKARNTLPWGLASDTARDGRGRIEVDESSLPEAPCPCWLLPVRDEIAEHVARLAPQLASSACQRRLLGHDHGHDHGHHHRGHHQQLLRQHSPAAVCQGNEPWHHSVQSCPWAARVSVARRGSRAGPGCWLSVIYC